MFINRRNALAGGAIGAVLAAVPAMARPRWDAVVSRQRTGAVATLAEAFELAMRAGGQPFSILLDSGVYHEKLTLTVPNVTIAGVGPASVLAYGAAAGLRRPDGATWGTSGSATLTIDAERTTLRNLTVRNSFDYIAQYRPGPGDGAQAVALAVGRLADRTRITDCAIEGYQDTLLVQARTAITGCRIFGTIDFVFGGAAALFRQCNIITQHVPAALSSGYVAAPSTPAQQPFGFVFDRCRLAREPGVPDSSTYLGRPWRAGNNMTLVGASAFLDCWMDAHIARDGWTSMDFTDPAGNRRPLQPWEARLFEYRSRGPGAGPAERSRRLLTAEQARAYTRAAILSGWRP